MAQKIIWSEQAHNDRRQILEYWIEHNKSKAYSIKLNMLFKEAVRIIAKFPGIGKSTDIKGVRGKIIRNYIIFYQLMDDQLQILSIWDSRQNPDKRRAKIKKGSG